MTDHVLIEKSDGVLTLTLNRPDKANALTLDMYARLGEAIRNADTDPETRCILLLAAGPVFTAGFDISAFSTISSGLSDGRELTEGSPLIDSLARSTTPIVVAVNGRAVGVGTTMLLHCDLVFLADDAVLSTPFANLALVPEAASSMLLPARIGHPRAFAMFALGQSVDAMTAEAWGLANAVVPGDRLQALARDAATKLAARPPSAIAITKRLMRESADLLERIEEEVGHFGKQLRSPEAKECFAAFAEKRQPIF